jgi:hypothetical protein
MDIHEQVRDKLLDIIAVLVYKQSKRKYMDYSRPWWIVSFWGDPLHGSRLLSKTPWKFNNGGAKPGSTTDIKNGNGNREEVL